MARPVLTRLRERAEVETTLDESPDQGDWYNQPAAWTAHGSDNLSGIDTCESDSYAGPDGDNRTVSGSCTDVAGNQASDESDPFKYDATAPEVAKLDSGPDNDPWYNQPVCRRLGALRLRRHRAEPESERDTEPPAAHRSATASPNATDNLSGIDSASCAAPDTSTTGVKTIE